MPRVKRSQYAACEFCGESFDVTKRHRPATYAGQYCSRECSFAARKAQGFYQQKLSPAGIAAQLDYKQQHGKVPGPPRGGARPRSKLDTHSAIGYTTLSTAD